jgi:hypothetical protein
MTSAVILAMLIAGTPMLSEEPRFAIYLVAPELECRTSTTHQDGLYRTSVPLDEVELAPRPWITDHDIGSFDADTATMTILDGLTIPYPTPSLHGSVFVVEVDGERVLAGTFWTPYSSYCCCPLPTIMTEPDQDRTEFLNGIARQFRIGGLPEDLRFGPLFDELGKVSR